MPEGIEVRILYKGALNKIVYQQVDGIRVAMGYTGCKDLNEMRSKSKFVRLTNSGMRESHVHDVSIPKEPPNYQMN